MRKFARLILLAAIPAALHASDPPVAPPEYDADDTLRLVDTADFLADDTLRLVDTADFLADDTLRLADADSSLADAPDTAVKPEGTHVGVGFGVSVGALPLFAMWREALPASIVDFGLTSLFGAALSVGDTLPLIYGVVESPDMFNFTLPVSVSLYRVVDGGAASLSLSFFRSGKEFAAELVSALNDTAIRRVGIHERLSYTSLTLEAARVWSIPPAFFSVDGARSAYFAVAAGFGPLNYISRGGNIKGIFGDDDARMTAVLDSARARFAELTSNGASFTWRIGLGAIKANARGGALDMGISYGGSYAAYFRGDGRATVRGMINPNDPNANKPLSFISNRIEFKVTLLSPVRRPRAESDVDDGVDNESAVDE